MSMHTPEDLPEWWEQLGWDAWSSELGPDATDAAWLTPASAQWSWDAESLLMGELVGYPLYLRLRDRLCELNIPTVAHDVLIQEMIECHDESLLEQGVACSTLLFHDRGDTQDRVEMVVLDMASMGPISAWDPGPGDAAG